MPIEDISPEALRRYMQTHHEKTYRLVDVRQPGEYEMDHIPGAQLLPLPQLMQSVEGLPTDRELIFYCRSGARSATAALMTEEEDVTGHPIYNLDGGILAWDGAMVDRQPRVALFHDQSVDEMMATAMNLEKAAMRFYAHVAEAFADQSWSQIFGRLGKVETAHARTVYQFRRRANKDLAPFETLFEELSGDVLEGGRPLAEALSALQGPSGGTCLGLIEMALDMENRAFDLYRTMADQAEDEAREAFLTIAQAEKGHMGALVKAIAECR